MRKIEICLSPDLIHRYSLENKIVVVVDIFRATSTMVTALGNGVNSILPVEDLETCRALKQKGYTIAGERNGLPAEGFELGNSPLSYLNGAFQGHQIAMTTTNGTLAIEKSKKGASEVLIGAFLNLQTTTDFILEHKEDVVILCAGWKGKFNLEDSLYAGALASKLSEHFDRDCDAVIGMSDLYLQHRNNLRPFLNQASHAKRLQNHHIEADIDFCLELDVFDVLGRLKNDLLVRF
ncbi:2-phosphosulfolactate phosphatase [Pararhodonellum marinum]|uniref:2-phosphosulfolactate phosphatase n=1 Tax=Pararhodonellum marinum TaxID=2755358 RepID=UPI00188E40DC|nr:2-phosphosulfolactate phosphatase [Pararhodonellum marinum]